MTFRQDVETPQDERPQDKHVAFYADDPAPPQDSGVWINHGWYWEFIPVGGQW